jgi:hypothetical protein
MAFALLFVNEAWKKPSLPIQMCPLLVSSFEPDGILRALRRASASDSAVLVFSVSEYCHRVLRLVARISYLERDELETCLRYLNPDGLAKA